MELKFDEKGLIPAIVQDHYTKEVLTLAYMNAESLAITIDEGRTCFWSRSRQELWRKGETSGNVQRVVSITADCDADALVVEVVKAGPACHTGERSCFCRSLCGEADSTEATFLGRLWRYLNIRKDDDPQESYTARLLRSGLSRVAQKVGEEGVETALACATKDRGGFRYEAADLLYHLLVACVAAEVPFDEVLRELASRHKGAERQ